MEESISPHFYKNEMVKVAAVQMVVSHDKQENLNKILYYIAKAKKENIDLVVFPETSMVVIPSCSTTMYADLAESLDGRFVRTLAAAAKKHRIYVICGILEKRIGERTRAYNTAIFLDDQGNLIHRHRKTHLYDAFSYNESRNIISGENSLSPVKTRFGTVGILICYELRFPEITRTLALQGANILVVPTAWVAGFMKEEHLSILSRVRAIENTIFVCVANQTGNVYVGHSGIYDPMGVVMAKRSKGEGLLFADIDTNHVIDIREKLPVLKQRHPEFYKLN